MSFTVEPIDQNTRHLVRKLISTWLAEFIISCGRKLCPAELPGFVALNDREELCGLVTIEIIDDQCEIVTLDALDQWQGIGTILLDHATKAAAQAGCTRLWLITTNDNIDALRFYQRRGMNIADIHVKALEQSRKLKPVIPKVGMYEIPLRDEIVFERWL